MSRNTFLYSVRTQSGITFYIEAGNRREAENRASDPAVISRIFQLIRSELSNIELIEPHRGPTYQLGGKLVFQNELFEK